MQPPPPPPPPTVVFVPDTWTLQRTLHIQMLLSGCTCTPVPKAAALRPDRWKQSTSISLRTTQHWSQEPLKLLKGRTLELHMNPSPTPYFDAVIYTAEKRGPHSSISRRQLTFAKAPLEKGPLFPGLIPLLLLHHNLCHSTSGKRPTVSRPHSSTPVPHID